MDILIVKPKWAELILNGDKTWEIRGNNTKKRGYIQIAKSRTNQIYGKVKLIDSIELDEEKWDKYKDLHRVEISWQELKAIYKRPCAWVMSDAVLYEEPIEYIHPKGAVIWVKELNTVDKENISGGKRK